MEKSKFDKISYVMGHVVVITIGLCAIASVIGLTVKFLLWLF